MLILDYEGLHSQSMLKIIEHISENMSNSNRYQNIFNFARKLWIYIFCIVVYRTYFRECIKF